MSSVMDGVEVLAEDDGGGAIETSDPVGRRIFKIANKDTGDTIRLRVAVTATIEAVITAVYEDFGIARQADDRLKCRGTGEDVFPFAHLTVKQYLEDGHCAGLHWEFASGTGGA